MPAGFSLEWQSGKSPAVLAAKLTALDRHVEGSARDAMKRMGEQGERLAKAKAPVDTGALRNSISHTVTSSGSVHTLELSAGVEYAVYQEFGTRYMNAQPFLGPAVEAIWPMLEPEVKRAVLSAL